MTNEEVFKKHYVAVIGGSISGSEAANLLAQNGFRVVVFDMNSLPYGKIEDGLPSWHINLRDRQINEINKKLEHPNIRFVPDTKIGIDIDFMELVNDWGFSAIIIANGAWKDRALPIPNIEKFIDKELIYQNNFIYWFNHKHEKNYDFHHYQIKDNSLVIGGGLASLDVIKVIMIELVQKQLIEQKGIDVDMFTLEKEGIEKVLKKYQVDFDELGIGKAKLAYRRTARDMPLKEPKDDSQESKEKARNVSEKLLKKYVEKYFFDFLPLSVPVNYTESKGKLTGIIFQNVNLENGKIIPVKDSFYEVKTDMVISSIGSIPEKMEGLEYEYSSLKMRAEANDYHVYGFDNVFAVGNAVTGRGNIQESKQHGRQMTEVIMDKHLTEDAFEKWLIDYNTKIKDSVKDQIEAIVKEISAQEIQPQFIIQGILDKTDVIHKHLGFKSYQDWISRNMPQRLEDKIGYNK